MLVGFGRLDHGCGVVGCQGRFFALQTTSSASVRPVKKAPIGWRFVGKNGEFEIDDPDRSSYLYFPVANEAGIMSSVTPSLGGDVKTGQNTFATEPVSAERLHDSRATRNFWLLVEGKGAWSCTGESASQRAARALGSRKERCKLRAGILWHKLTRENRALGIRAEITTFAPMTPDRVELTRVVVTNITNKPVTLTPTAAFPIYGRSADNIRDHRHVTSLLHRIRTTRFSVEVKPTLTFDERGHKPNAVRYAVLGATGDGEPPRGFFPVVEDFLGEGGAYDAPQAVFNNLDPTCGAGAAFDGLEAVGALRFATRTLDPGGSASFVVAYAISATDGVGFDPDALGATYLSSAAFDRLFAEAAEAWQKKIEPIDFRTGDERFDGWMRWVAVQPILRRIYGCSFLPHHDYGRGGRGWRDLWQDCLALLLMEPDAARGYLLNNYAGVRIDGSNATIIGAGQGEFIADRNNIARSWMDHGAWPWLTTRLYLDLSGDLGFLLEPQRWFKDRLTRRAKAADPGWTPEYGNRQKTAAGAEYASSVLEHVLVQNLVQFFNVGDHNVIRLEDADWNDGLDMAGRRGESVAFTSLYAGNLADIARVLRALGQRGVATELDIAEEVAMLLDRAVGEPRVDYESVEGKRALLDRYWNACVHDLSGTTVKVALSAIAADLDEKAAWLATRVREQEWITDQNGRSWFNGYYDDGGRRVEGDFPSGVRMTLTGQVFALMCGVATDEQVRSVVDSAKAYLEDPKIGGYRLNTDFGEVKLDLGRSFGFALGHKENGAMFSHMAVMYANALYARNRCRDGWHVIDTIYAAATDFERARVYPGVPEYINERRRGMYAYLTGSASWLLYTMLDRVFGVRGRLGDLEITPRLLASQFDKKRTASTRTVFAGRTLEVVLKNRSKLDPDAYEIERVLVDGQPADVRRDGRSAVIDRAVVEALDPTTHHRIEVSLRKRS
jgi:cellobiose phosphorylase